MSSACSASSRTCRTARRSGRATSSPRCRARRSRSSTPTPRAGSCWPTCSGTSQERFKPAFMVDLATLTGAILVALGQEHAGLFSNNDELAERLTKAGQATGEKLWRMPMAPAYDKMIDSKFADMKNTGGRHARLDHRGAVPAALRRQDALGASRHRRHRHGLAAERHQPELGLRAGACGCSTGWWRIITRSDSQRVHRHRQLIGRLVGCGLALIAETQRCRATSFQRRAACSLLCRYSLLNAMRSRKRLLLFRPYP